MTASERCPQEGLGTNVAFGGWGRQQQMTVRERLPQPWPPGPKYTSTSTDLDKQPGALRTPLSEDTHQQGPITVTPWQPWLCRMKNVS